MKLLSTDIRNDGRFQQNLKRMLLFIAFFFMADRACNFFLQGGLERYYGLTGRPEIALVGHSHLLLGVDHVMLEKGLGAPVAKYTREGVNVADRLQMIKQLLAHNPNTKIVVYGVDAHLFTGEGLSKNSYKLFYPFQNDSSIDRYLKANETEAFAYYRHKLIASSRYDEKLFVAAMRGYLGKWDSFKFATVNTQQLKADIATDNFRKVKFESENIQTFRETLALLHERGIKTVLFFIPTIDLLNQAHPESFAKAVALFKQCEQDFPGLVYLDYNEPYSHDATLFADAIHLNAKGQQAISPRLVADIKALR